MPVVLNPAVETNSYSYKELRNITKLQFLDIPYGRPKDLTSNNHKEKLDKHYQRKQHNIKNQAKNLHQ
jgi:hypothetical protein